MSNLSFRYLVLKDAVRLVPGILAQMLGGFGVAIVLGIYMSPKVMGLYTLFWLAQAYASTLSTGWIQNSLIRFLPESPSYLRGFLNLCFSTVLVFGVLGLGISLVLSVVWGDKFKWTYLVCTVLIMCGSSFFITFQNSFRGLFEQHWFTISAVMLAVTKLVLLFVFLSISKDHVMAALTAMVVAYVPVLLWQWSKLRGIQTQNHQSIRMIEQTLLRRSLSYGMPLTLSLFFITLLQTGDRYILATLVTMKDVGIYTFWMSIGLQLGRGLYRILFMILNPRLFQVHHGDPIRAKLLVQRLIKLYVLTIMPVFTTIGLLLPPILLCLKIKPEYIPGAHLIFYSLGMSFLLGLSQLCGIRYNFEKKTTIFMFASFIGVIIMIIGTYMLTPFLGLHGAATATLTGFGTYFLLIAMFSKILPSWSDILIAILCSFALFTCFQWVSHYFSIFQGFIILISSLMTYFIIVLKIANYAKNISN